MAPEYLFLRRSIVLASALVYWGGVLVQARRVRKQIGRSPNLKPRGPKEKLLWAGWFLVVVTWMFQPLLAGSPAAPAGLRMVPAFLHPAGLALGIGLVVAGYAGTLWCYAAMGNTWRIGINPNERTPLITRGPYRRVRHPIYLFQLVMLVGALLLLPTWLSLVIFLLHLLCVWAKAADEEAYLLAMHGRDYRDYLGRTGRLFPRLWRTASLAE